MMSLVFGRWWKQRPRNLPAKRQGGSIPASALNTAETALKPMLAL
ncbi:hypothetical protein P775_22770 [Puniceibacterium antarcticum]|uniref:Uncharacterized protein n=1 Tax=Puniceibacterium antarcticum TaxID=1206336 RepID=A0A2G8R8H4_9RHOB|nr:hypothetical protein P775_22770 [Puniceibacterium antarcticum]